MAVRDFLRAADQVNQARGLEADQFLRGLAALGGKKGVVGGAFGEFERQAEEREKKQQESALAELAQQLMSEGHQAQQRQDATPAAATQAAAVAGQMGAGVAGLPGIAAGLGPVGQQAGSQVQQIANRPTPTLPANLDPQTLRALVGNQLDARSSRASAKQRMFERQGDRAFTRSENALDRQSRAGLQQSMFENTRALRGEDREFTGTEAEKDRQLRRDTEATRAATAAVKIAFDQKVQEARLDLDRAKQEFAQKQAEIEAQAAEASKVEAQNLARRMGIDNPEQFQSLDALELHASQDLAINKALVKSRIDAARLDLDRQRLELEKQKFAEMSPLMLAVLGMLARPATEAESLAPVLETGTTENLGERVQQNKVKKVEDAMKKARELSGSGEEPSPIKDFKDFK